MVQTPLTSLHGLLIYYDSQPRFDGPVRKKLFTLCAKRSADTAPLLPYFVVRRAAAALCRRSVHGSHHS